MSRAGGDIRILLDGRAVACPAGIPLAQVLSQHMAHWRRSPRLGQPRGMFCGMGVCFECMVEVNGALRRSCLTMTQDGMEVRTGAAPEAGAHG